MEIVRKVHAMKELARRARAAGRRIGFVPTMGYLHEGHMSLVRRVKAECDVTVVSIFVNPTQFGPHEDFTRYPRDLARDSDLCIREGVDVVFSPEAAEMYPEGASTFVGAVCLARFGGCRGQADAAVEREGRSRRDYASRAADHGRQE